MKIINFITLIFIFTSCQTMKENPNGTKGAALGAATGAVLGAVIGHQTGNRDKGAAIGAALGVGIGTLAGRRLDKQQKELQHLAQTKRTDQGLITELKSDILFDNGKADLKPQAKKNIEQLAVILKKYPENNLTIKGYTDFTGTDKINLPLSEQRAQAVRRHLIQSGIPATTVGSVGFGSANPIDPGTSSESLARNRRVEIEISVDESRIPN